MAGVKGRSGGARKNAGGARANAGGKRPGAGRKPKNQQQKPAAQPKVPATSNEAPGADLPATRSQTPLNYLLEVMNDPKAEQALRVRAALGAAPYVHGKATELGKKDAKQLAALGVTKSSRFTPAAAPLKLVGKK
jgi:phage terminase small subunit